MTMMQEGDMEYRPFGQTGLQVSAIGFGCWEIGGGYGHFDEAEVIAAIHRAMDLGINCFDTAEGYGKGRSEALLAKALGARRRDVLVVTKFGIGYNDSGREKGRDSRRAMAMAAIERSLQFLQTDYVDVYLVHWPDPNTPFAETMQALEHIVQQGKARFVGVSNFRPEQLAACMATRRVDVAQYGYHLFDRRMEREIFPYCQTHSIGMMAYGSLAHGLLTGAFTEETTFEESDWRSRGGAFNLKLFAPENFARNVRAVEELKDIAARRGKKVNHLALRWVLSNPTVSVALVGCRTPAEVDDNLDALDWTLTDDDRAAIHAIFSQHGVEVAPEVWVE
jgi:aryl-alcohol dehydrogenase-like predicted oxidoreductase